MLETIKTFWNNTISVFSKSNNENIETIDDLPWDFVDYDEIEDIWDDFPEEYEPMSDIEHDFYQIIDN